MRKRRGRRASGSLLAKPGSHHINQSERGECSQGLVCYQFPHKSGPSILSEGTGSNRSAVPAEIMTRNYHICAQDVTKLPPLHFLPHEYHYWDILVTQSTNIAV